MGEYFVKVLHRMLTCTSSQRDVKNFIYMHSKLLEDAIELQLFVTTSNTCYKATLKHDEIKTACEELEQPSYDDFFAECKQALTTHMGLDGFDYELDEKELKFKLWKCKGFETMYIETTVRKVSQIHQLLDAAIEWGQQQASIEANKPSTSERLPTEKDYQLMVSKYDKYIDEYQKRERILLMKFLALLNTKEERITELQKEIEELKKHSALDVDSDAETDADKDCDEEYWHPKARASEDDDYAASTQELTQEEPTQK